MTETAQVPAVHRTLQVALNGDSAHPAMPRTAAEIAADAAACVAAGASVIHLHAFDDDGVETLDGAAVGRVIDAVRITCPAIPISMTTFAQIEPDPAKRLSVVAGWSRLPDLIPANQGEDGIVELTDMAITRGMGVEACVFTVEDAELLVRRGRTERFQRIYVEPMDTDPKAACEHAIAMEQVIVAAGIALEQVHHGMGRATWPVLEQAVARGRGIRIGIEDTSLLPNGAMTPGNVALVRAAQVFLDNSNPA